MCGIAGVFLRQTLAEPKGLSVMAERIAHRGPDNTNIHLDGTLGLVHARLSIIDLAGGDQPLFAEDGKLALVANGEIYNFIELRQDLEARGAVFATHSDCETILHAYRHYGDGFLDRLNGMFAFALYDKAINRLILARDRLGIKPLFFTETPDGLYFASEQKALFPFVPGGLTIRGEALIQTLETGFDTGVHTLVSGIERLQPSEIACFEQGKLTSRRRYWSYHSLTSNDMDYAEAAEHFDSMMECIMREHMRSDVPFALFLSGGIDSSVVLEWLRREEGTRELASYTVAITDAANQDDLAAAATLAQRLGLRHHVVETDSKAMINHMPFTVWAACDFITDKAVLPTSLLARVVARDFKVVFSGEGGDELFAGYGRYRRMRWQRWLANLMAPGSGGFRTRGLLGRTWRKRLLGPDLRQHAKAGRQGFIDAWRNTPAGWTGLQRMQCTDLQTELTDQLLVKVDRMLMAWGLEGRVPLLDHRLVEFALALPDELKVRGREGKHFLKRWAEPIYGADFVKRPKRGFSVPVIQCLEGQNLARLKQILPRHKALEGLFEPAAVADLLARQEARQDVADLVWSLLQFAVWHRIFVDGAGQKPALDANPVEFIA